MKISNKKTKDKKRADSQQLYYIQLDCNLYTYQQLLSISQSAFFPAVTPDYEIWPWIFDDPKKPATGADVAPQTDHDREKQRNQSLKVCPESIGLGATSSREG
jgi:hypothetical protein